MKGETEVREKMKDVLNRYDNETYQPDKEYFDSVVGALMWVLDEGDDPLMDY